MQPTARGAYRARITQSGVGRSKTKGSPQFTAEFECFEFDNNGEWQAIDPVTITGWFYPMFAAGGVNERTVSSLEEALGWNRATGFTGLAGDFIGVEVQVYLDFETDDKNQPKIKVKWLNPRDYEGPSGISTDPAEVAEMDRQFGNLFRATAKKATAKAPSPPPIGGAAQASEDLKNAKRHAWDAFCTANPTCNAKEPGQWRAALSQYFRGRTIDSVGAVEWRKFKVDGFKRPAENPIPEGEQFKEDEIPF